MKPTNYEISVHGRVGPALTSAFDGLTVSIEPTGTVISGQIADQAALHGVLDLIESLGLELLDVRRVEPTH